MAASVARGEAPMSEWRFCADFAKHVGLPGDIRCCGSCLSDRDEFNMSIIEFEEGDELQPPVPPGVVFSICCTHFAWYEQKAASLPDKPDGAVTPPTNVTP